MGVVTEDNRLNLHAFCNRQQYGKLCKLGVQSVRDDDDDDDDNNNNNNTGQPGSTMNHSECG